MNFFPYIKRNSIILSILFIAVLATTSFAIKVRQSDASIGLPFGGMIWSEMICTCSPGLALFVQAYPPAVPGYYVYTATTMPYSWYMFHPGAWILGSYLPGAQSCWMVYGTTCGPLPGVIGTITMAGTSM